MIERDVKFVKLPKLNKHSDRIFRLLWIQDINTEPTRNFYKVLFQDINSKMYIMEEVFPECLHAYYAVGLHYQDNNLLQDIPPIGKIYPVSFETTDKNRFCSISDVLADCEYNLTHFFMGKKDKADFTIPNKHQRCVVFEDENSMLIFPCSVVGARYYYISSRMRRQLFIASLRGLYEESVLDREKRHATILLRPSVSPEDAPYIARFATNDFAMARWKAVHSAMIKTRREMEFRGEKAAFVPLEIDFPVKQVLNMEVRGLRFLDQTRGKYKILVLEILREDSRFEFDVLEVQQKGKLMKPGASRAMHTRTYQTKDLIINKPPSLSLSPIVLSTLQKERNANVEKIRVVKVTLTETNGDQPPENTNKIGETSGEVGISLIDSSAKEDKVARRADLETQAKEKKKDKDDAKVEFNLRDFAEIVSYLNRFEGVVNLEVYDEKIISREFTKRVKQRFSRKERYRDALASPRKYRCATLGYKSNNVCLIEIDHTQLPNGPGTYALVSTDSVGQLLAYSKAIVNMFVRKELLKEAIEDLAVKGVLLIPKKHPSKKDNIYYTRWCDELLQRIDKKLS